MKKFVAALGATLALSAGSLAVTAPAQAAGGDACITKAEYKKVKKGQSLAKVAKIVGTKGKVYSKTDAGSGFVVVTRTFKACKPFNKKSGIAIAFDNMEPDMTKGSLKVAAKQATWIHN